MYKNATHNTFSLQCGKHMRSDENKQRGEDEDKDIKEVEKGERGRAALVQVD